MYTDGQTWYNDFAVVEQVDTGDFPLKPDGIMSGANPDPQIHYRRDKGMERSELLERLREDISWLGDCDTERRIISHIEDAIKVLKEQEAEIEQLNRFVNGFSRDAVPVVRCKNCANNCIVKKLRFDPEWFCADGSAITNES